MELKLLVTLKFEALIKNVKLNKEKKNTHHYTNTPLFVKKKHKYIEKSLFKNFLNKNFGLENFFFKDLINLILFLKKKLNKINSYILTAIFNAQECV